MYWARSSPVRPALGALCRRSRPRLLYEMRLSLCAVLGLSCRDAGGTGRRPLSLVQLRWKWKAWKLLSIGIGAFLLRDCDNRRWGSRPAQIRGSRLHVLSQWGCEGDRGRHDNYGEGSIEQRPECCRDRRYCGVSRTTDWRISRKKYTAPACNAC